MQSEIPKIIDAATRAPLNGATGKVVLFLLLTAIVCWFPWSLVVIILLLIALFAVAHIVLQIQYREHCAYLRNNPPMRIDDAVQARFDSERKRIEREKGKLLDAETSQKELIESIETDCIVHRMSTSRNIMQVRQECVRRLQDLDADCDRRLAGLVSARQRELDEITASETAKLQTVMERLAWNSERREETLAAALAAKQEKFFEQFLAQHALTDNSVIGLTSADITHLLNAGIKTAADAVHDNIVNLQLPQEKVQALQKWRNFLLVQMELSRPILGETEKRRAIRKARINDDNLIQEKQHLVAIIETKESDIRDLYDVAIRRANELRDIDRRKLEAELANLPKRESFELETLNKNAEQKKHAAQQAIQKIRTKLAQLDERLNQLEEELKKSARPFTELPTWQEFVRLSNTNTRGDA